MAILLSKMPQAKTHSPAPGTCEAVCLNGAGAPGDGRSERSNSAVEDSPGRSAAAFRCRPSPGSVRWKRELLRDRDSPVGRLPHISASSGTIRTGHCRRDFLGGSCERHSRFTTLVKVPSKDTAVVLAALSRHVRKLPPALR